MGTRGRRGRRQRGELLERPNAHLYDTGGMRRVHLRGHSNILKRLLVHVCGFNLGLLMRQRTGVGRLEIDRAWQSGEVNGAIAIRAVGLADFHADPADRLIVATALEGHRLVTADERILGWTGPLSRVRADQ